MILLQTRKGSTARGRKLVNPFPGARPYAQTDRHYFFGRAAEIAALSSLVRAQQLVLLYAPSGAGKSSLIHAGLLRELSADDEAGGGTEAGRQAAAAGTFDVLGIANVHPGTVRDGDHWPGPDDVPNVYVKAALDSLGRGLLATHSTFESYLEEREQSVDEFGDPVPSLIIFDQFEEILEPFDRSDWLDCRDDFIDQLDKALCADPSLHVVISIREDHLATIENLLSKMTVPVRARYRMDRLRVDSARTAIKKATAASDVPIDDGRDVPEDEEVGDALGTLMDDLQKRHLAVAKPSWLERVFTQLRRREPASDAHPIPDEFIDPGLLSVVCRRLWFLAVGEGSRGQEADGPRRITLADVDRLGGVEGALERYYDDAIGRLARGGNERRLRRFFEHRLISAHGTRQLVPYDPSSQKSYGIKQTVIVELLETYGLLDKEHRGSVHYLELSHDGFVLPVQNANQTFRRARRKKRNTLVGALLIGVVAWLAFALTRDDGSTDQVVVPIEAAQSVATVPDVEGMQYTEAVDLISEAGIHAQTENTRSSAPPGEVVRQIPLAGERATNVVIVVSAGEGIVVNDNAVRVAPGDQPAPVDVLLNDEPAETGEPLRLESVRPTGPVEASIVDDHIEVAARVAGAFEVTYTVTDGFESASGTLLVEAVAVEAIAAPAASEIAAGSSVEFVDMSTGLDLERTWTFGDSETTSTDSTVVHQFDEPGSFVVRLEVTDSAGHSDTTLVEVTVEDGPRTVTFVAEDVNLRSASTDGSQVTSSIDDATGSQLEVDPEPVDGWYRVATGDRADQWVFGALIVPQDGSLQVGETLSGEPADLLDEDGEPLPKPNPSGRLVLVQAANGNLYEVLLPDGSVAYVNVADVRILVQATPLQSSLEFAGG